MAKLASVVVAMVGGAAFLLNPLYACNALEPSFDFGAAELTAAVEGQWRVTITRADGSMQSAVLEVHQSTQVRASRAAPSLVGEASACGERTLIQSAGACVDSTSMPLRVALVSGALAGPYRGDLQVYGTSFERGELSFYLGGSKLHLAISPAGAVLSPVTIDGSGAGARATAVRIDPAP